MHLLLLAALGLLLPAAAASADRTCAPAGQVDVYGLSSPTDDLARVAELSGAIAPTSRLLRRGGDRTETVCADVSFPWPAFARPSGVAADRDESSEPSVRALPFRLVSELNSTHPAGDNDGLLWAGRGVSQLASFGGAFRWRALSLAIAPEATWSENRFFDTVPTGLSGAQRFGNGFYPTGIDLPQRFGAGPYAAWGPGQSYLRVDVWNVAAGLSTENLWFGPGIRNAIVMSNAGPGFPHAFVGTSRPADIWIGKAEALLFWGRLERTEFIRGGTHPLINGLVLTYEPRWVPGLHLGFARMFTQVWKDLTLRNWLSVFQALDKQSVATASDPTGDNANDNQIASLFGRWVFPEVGFEVYGEWAREDYNWSWWSELREPDHAEAFLIGLQKVFRTAAGHVLRVYAENTVLQEMAGFKSSRPFAVYYVHGNDLGLTNRGQLLGAWIGPGGSSQTLAVDVFHAGGRIGGYVERVRRNDAYYWTVIEPTVGNFSHDVEIALGLRQALTLGPAEITWEAAASYRQNRDFIRHEPNLKLVLGLAFPLTPASAASRRGAGTSPPAP